MSLPLADQQILAEILVEFLEVLVHQTLHLRQVYPRDIFQKASKYGGLGVWESRHPDLNDYIARVLVNARPLIAKGAVRELAICLHDHSDKVSERIVIGIDGIAAAATATNKGDDRPTMDVRTIGLLENELRGVLTSLITQLTAKHGDPEGFQNEFSTFSLRLITSMSSAAVQRLGTNEWLEAADPPARGGRAGSGGSGSAVRIVRVFSSDATSLGLRLTWEAGT